MSDVHKRSVGSYALPGARPQPQLPRLQERRPGARAVRARNTLLLLDLIGGALCVVAFRVELLPGATLLAFVMALFAGAGLYRERLTLSALDDLPAIVGRTLVGGMVVTTVMLAVDESYHSRRLLYATLAWAAVAVVLRALAYQRIRKVRSRHRNEHPTLIIGAGRVGQHIARTLLEHPEYGLRPVGLLDEKPPVIDDDVPLPVPVLNERDAVLVDVVRRYGIRHVVIAYSSARESDMVDVIRQCDRLNCEIFLVPRLFELAHDRGPTDHIWGMPLARLPRAALRSPTWHLKRAMDVLLSGTALLLLTPVLLVCALLVKLEHRGSVLFRQERVGLDGKHFELLKFQSLRPATREESATRWNVSADQRLGRVGRLLRRTSLDELPQLWNILRGDMSIVGPRPERPYFVAEFTGAFPRYMARHRVPSGLTGWAQIHNLRGDTSIEERVRFDNYYIEHWSLWGDMKIILRTVPQVLRASGG